RRPSASSSGRPARCSRLRWPRPRRTRRGEDEASGRTARGLGVARRRRPRSPAPSRPEAVSAPPPSRVSPATMLSRSPEASAPGRRCAVGPLLAIFVVISLNMAPDGAQTVTLDSDVVEGVGIAADATRFLLTRMDEGRWLLHDAQGRPWYTVEVDGPWLTLTTQAGTSDRIDLGAAL